MRPITPNETSLFTARQLLITTGLSLGYLLLSLLLIGFKSEQVTLILLFNICYYLSFTTRKFITGFSIFIIFWIIFDYMKALPNYLYHTVHIESLYRAEKNLFGIQVNGHVLTPNEYLRMHTSTFLDVMAGIFYLSWVPVPLAFAAFLFFKKRRSFLSFSLTFLLVNLIGFAIYYLYPAAPPWYVQQHGFVLEAATRGNTAGLEGFDRFFNTTVFSSLYAKSSNVFAAMPSLHASYPLIVLYYAVKNRLGRIILFFITLMCGIWFSAVYTGHHYVLDVLAGIGCAMTGIFFFQLMNNRNTFIRRWTDGYYAAIS